MPVELHPHELLRAYLDSKGIKYGFVASQINMPSSTFSEILNGKRKMTASQVAKICDALDISAEVLIPRKQDSA